MKRGALVRWIRGVLYGLFVFDFESEVRAEGLRQRDVFMALTVGELLGLPLHHSYYTLRLLPHLQGDLPQWRRRVCRERWVY